MYKINCDSDFKIIEGFKDNSSISSSHFKFTYYTRPNREVLEASYTITDDGKEIFDNCRLTEDNKLIVAFDDHQLGTGRLKVRREFYLNDADFQSGICDLVTDEELSPENIMPKAFDPRVGKTVAKAVAEVKAGKIDFKVDKYGIIHTAVGKVSFTPEQIVENAKEVINTIIKLKPSAAKGTYVLSIYLSTTMSPGLQVDPKSVETK